MRVETLSYLDPVKFWPQPLLDDVLLLVPSYTGMHPSTLNFVNQCVGAGADLCSSWGCSDVAMHRCLVAGQAMRRIAESPGRYSWIVWLDDDMVATPSHVAGLVEFVRMLGTAVSGSYCKRGNPNELTWKAYPSFPRKVRLTVGNHSYFELLDCYPITCGMGCLALSVENFVRHCESVPRWARRVKGERLDIVPGICASGMSQDDAGELGWRSEDQVYCEGLWHYGIKLFGVPIDFGHVSQVALRPSVDATWLGGLNEFELPLGTEPVLGSVPPSMKGGSVSVQALDVSLDDNPTLTEVPSFGEE